MITIKAGEWEDVKTVVKDIHDVEFNKLAVMCIKKPKLVSRHIGKYLGLNFIGRLKILGALRVFSYMSKLEQFTPKDKRGWYKLMDPIPENVNVTSILNSLENSYSVFRWFDKLKVDYGNGKFHVFEINHEDINKKPIYKDPFKETLMPNLFEYIQTYWDGGNKPVKFGVI